MTIILALASLIFCLVSRLLYAEIELYTDYIDDEVLSTDKDETSDRITAFYHIYTGSGHHERVVQEQINHMKKSGLLPHLSTIYYTIVGNKDYTIPDKKFKKSQYLDRGSESHTHSRIYQFCRENPSQKILYFHTKGILEVKIQPVYEKHRQALNAFTLNTACISTLDEFDVCGWRLSPLPFVHYSGNFWWARCSYINTLIDPALLYSRSLLQTISLRAFEPTVKKHAAGCLGFEDFFSESWIGSAPRLSGADCLGDISPAYMFSSSIPPDIIGLSEMINKRPAKHDLVCTSAGTNASVEIFQRTFDREFKMFSCANIYNVSSRSWLWYDEPAYSQIEWRARYGDRLPENISPFDVHPDIRRHQQLANLEYSVAKSNAKLNVNRVKPKVTITSSDSSSVTDTIHSSTMSLDELGKENEALKRELKRVSDIAERLSLEVSALKQNKIRNVGRVVDYEPASLREAVPDSRAVALPVQEVKTVANLWDSAFSSLSRKQKATPSEPVKKKRGFFDQDEGKEDAGFGEEDEASSDPQESSPDDVVQPAAKGAKQGRSRNSKDPLANLRSRSGRQGRKNDRKRSAYQ